MLLRLLMSCMYLFPLVVMYYTLVCSVAIKLILVSVLLKPSITIVTLNNNRPYSFKPWPTLVKGGYNVQPTPTSLSTINIATLQYTCT